jgi:hypothetical protein
VTASVLTVNGVSYNQAARKTNSLLVDSWGWDVDGDYTLEFHEYVAGPQPQFAGPVPVTLTDPGGNLRFSGDLVSVSASWTENGRTWGYQCMGLKYRANQLPVVAVDGTGLMAFNLPLSDEDSIAANNGQSVGQIITTVLTQHAAALSAVGINSDATTGTQLGALTLVPTDPVYVEGGRLWQAMESVFQRWSRNNRLYILPSGLIRVLDVSAGSAHTLTLGTDPVDPPLFSRSWVDCATRYVVRGRGKIYPGYVSLAKATLTAAWSGAQQTAWNWSQFSNPKGATDAGTVTTVGGPTSVTVQSSDATRTWATNFWSGIQGWVILFKSSGAGALTYTESRPVTACTSLAAAGTSTLTLGYNLDNSASGAYDSYQLIGLAPGLSATSPLGLNNVYRLFTVSDPGSTIKNHLVKKFPVAFPFQFANNLGVIETNYPIAQIINGSGEGFNATFKVIPSTGQILFDRPVVEQLNSASVLATGGAGVVVPADIYAMLAYSRGALSAVYPPDSGGPVYSGTAYTAANLQRTRYADYDSWGYEGNNALMVSLAQMSQQAVRDTVVTGRVLYKGAYTTVYDPSGGHLLNFAGATYTTGDESLNIPVRSVRVTYQSSGGGNVYRTEMQCSTRRDPKTGESFYTHLSQMGSGDMLSRMSEWNPFNLAQPSFQAMNRSALIQGAGSSGGSQLDAAVGMFQQDIQQQMEQGSDYGAAVNAASDRLAETPMSADVRAMIFGPDSNA